MSLLLEGEIAIVTGSSGMGSGTEIARVFAAEGARVTVTGRDVDNGARVVTEIAAEGGQAVFVAADLANESDCAALVDQTVDQWGGLTVLVHSAVATEGGRHVSELGDAPIATVSDEIWNRNLQINLTSFLWLCRSALPVMQRAGRGAVVNIGSRAAERGTPDRASYTASKGAVHALIRSIAVDYAPDGIRANTVAPGFIEGKSRETYTDDVREWAARMHLTRTPTTTDVAYAAAFLASPVSGAITGHTMLVDGGSSMARAASLR
jgi:NAD(P)-dependent dehydrogenase (short-subunit alcohol dehydrogenase family)